MPRVKIDIPEHLPFKYLTDIRVTDLNYGNHLGNDRILQYCHDARVAYFHQLGQSELAFLGKGLIMADAEISFKSQGHLANKIEISIGAAEFTKYGFSLIYRLWNLSTEAELAQARTGMVFFDYTKNKIDQIPSGVKELFLQ